MVDKSFGLYRECAGDVRVESKSRLIAGAFPIQPLALSRFCEPMGIGFRRARRKAAIQKALAWQVGR